MAKSNHPSWGPSAQHFRHLEINLIRSAPIRAKEEEAEVEEKEGKLLSVLIIQCVSPREALVCSPLLKVVIWQEEFRKPDTPYIIVGEK